MKGLIPLWLIFSLFVYQMVLFLSWLIGFLTPGLVMRITLWGILFFLVGIVVGSQMERRRLGAKLSGAVSKARTQSKRTGA